LTEAQIRRRLLTLARPVLPPLGLSITFRMIGLATGIALLGLAGWAVLGGARLGGAQTAAIDGLADPSTLSDGPPLTAVLFVLVGLALVKGLARYLEQYCGHYVAFRALAQLRLYFYDRLAPQAPAAVEGRDTGDLLSRVTKDVDRVEVFFAHTIAPAVTGMIVPLVTLVYLGLAVTPLAVVPLAAGLMLVGVVSIGLSRAKAARSATMVRASRGQLASHVRDSVQGVREVLAFNYQQRRLDQLGDLARPLAQGLKGLGETVALRRGVNLSLVCLTLLAQFIVLVAAGVSPDILGLGLGITAGAFAPVLAVEDFSADLHQAYASARRIFEVTDAVPLVPDRALATPPDGPPAQPPVETNATQRTASPGPTTDRARVLEPSGGAASGKSGPKLNQSGRWAPEVRFEDVSFSYPGARGGPAALHGVSLTAPSGQVTAIVGASGGGKSTLAALLTRSWDPEAGRITLDGRDIKTWTLEELRDSVAVSSQRPYLFNLSLRQNLLLARPNATATELTRAAQAAQLDAVIASKQAGWDAPAGEMGELLSGGERQRLALARTLLRRPAVLVADEATSQLDSVTETGVLAGIMRASQGCTVLLIAHRLSTVRQADSVYVLDGGQVVQHGGYSELASRPGPFADLLAREAPQTRPGLAPWVEP
jgi:ABC-type multidrug transport system fused ATPase/permease subunit